MLEYPPNSGDPHALGAGIAQAIWSAELEPKQYPRRPEDVMDAPDDEWLSQVCVLPLSPATTTYGALQAGCMQKSTHQLDATFLALIICWPKRQSESQAGATMSLEPCHQSAYMSRVTQSSCCPLQAMMDAVPDWAETAKDMAALKAMVEIHHPRLPPDGPANGINLMRFKEGHGQYYARYLYEVRLCLQLAPRPTASSASTRWL